MQTESNKSKLNDSNEFNDSERFELNNSNKSEPNDKKPKCF